MRAPKGILVEGTWRVLVSAHTGMALRENREMVRGSWISARNLGGESGSGREKERRVSRAGARDAGGTSRRKRISRNLYDV